jgi:hypothetical protein
MPTEFIWLDKMGLMPKRCLFSIYISTRFDVILVFLERFNKGWWPLFALKNLD